MAKIDAKLEEVLAYISKYIEDNGFPPSVREIGSHLSIKSTATTYYYLEKLQQRGFLKKTKSKNRAIELTSKVKGTSRQVPLLGVITAGLPILASENIDCLLPVPADMFGDGDLFMLTVSGESMKNAGIYDGDKIIVKKQNHAKNGEIVAALIENEATVKRFYKYNDYYILHPENQTMQDIRVNQLEILGTVCGLIRKM